MSWTSTWQTKNLQLSWKHWPRQRKFAKTNSFCSPLWWEITRVTAKWHRTILNLCVTQPRMWNLLKLPYLTVRTKKLWNLQLCQRRTRLTTTPHLWKDHFRSIALCKLTRVISLSKITKIKIHINSSVWLLTALTMSAITRHDTTKKSCKKCAKS